DLLRARLQQERPDQVRLLHRRASEWFERSELLPEAIQHALAGEDVGRAADLLERAADPLLVGGQVATLHGWLAQLPSPVLRAHPRLLLAQLETLHLVDTPRPEALEAILREIEAALGASDAAPPDPAESTAVETDRLAGKIDAIHALHASERGDIWQAA